MDAGEFEGDELLLGRLREATGGDAGVRQLRRRYDALRADYEQLLDRLGEIEDRLAAPRPQPPPRRAVLAEPEAGIVEALAAPLIRLRDEYAAAANRIQEIVTGLERIAAGTLKGQHGAEPARAPATAGGSGAEPQPDAGNPPTPGRPRRVHVDVKGRGFGELLDFQERLSSVAGVARVTINAIDGERATLIVELENGGHQAD